MKSRKPLKWLYATFIIMIAVAFYHNTESTSVRKLSSDSSSGTSEAKQLTTQIEEFNASVKKLKKKYKRIEEDLKEKKISYEEAEELRDDFDTYFDSDKIAALKKEFEAIKKDKRTNQDFADMDFDDIDDQIRDANLKALRAERKQNKEDLDDAQCETYNTLANIRDLLDTKLQDNYNVISSLEQQASPQGYMEFYFERMFQRQMMVNPAASMFAMPMSPFSREVESMRAMANFGYRAPSIFDYEDQVFKLPRLEFPSVRSDRNLRNRMVSGGGNYSSQPIVINNYTNGFDSIRNPSQARAHELSPTRGSILQDMPQLIPQWNKGDGNVQIFKQRSTKA